eukprot:400823_1
MDIRTKIVTMSPDEHHVQFLSFYGAYDETTEKFGANNNPVYTDKLSLRHDLRNMSIKEIQQMILLRSEDVSFRSALKSYTQHLHTEFKKKINIIHNMNKNKQHTLQNKIKNNNYQILVHMITDPNSPQVWRRMTINGTTNMMQFDKILRKTFCLGIHSSYFKIPLNNKYFDIEIPHAQSKYFTKEILLFNGIKGSTDNYCFQHLYKPYSFPINHLLFGHIAPIFFDISKNIKTKNKIPFDQFKQDFFPGFYSKYSKESLHQIFDYDARYSNFYIDRNDCFQWCYDLGDNYIFNIYVEQIEKVKSKQNIFVCKYLNGSSCAPPEDIGSVEDWYKCILLCYGYKLNEINPSNSMIENGYKNKNIFYKWLKSTFKQHYEVFGLANSKTYLRYASMNKYQFDNYMKCNVISKLEMSKIRNISKNKLKRNIKTDNIPFYFPYFPINDCISSKIPILNTTTNCSKEFPILKRMQRNLLKLKYCSFCNRNNIKLRLCSKCKDVYYCSRSCQKRSWLCHRTLCLKC